jgi:hypothetical protein
MKKNALCLLLKDGCSWKNTRNTQDAISMLKSSLPEFIIEKKPWKSFVSIANRRHKDLRKLVTSLLLCFVLFAAFTASCTATNENEASSRINDAENALKNAFRTVKKAEGLNANVSGLVNDLNVAGGFLDEAEIAYKNEDLDIALKKADQSLAVANKVSGDATSLYDSASAGALRFFWLTFSFSMVGAVLFIVVLILVWRRSSRLYVKKMLKMKPEVT